MIHNFKNTEIWEDKANNTHKLSNSKLTSSLTSLVLRPISVHSPWINLKVYNTHSPWKIFGFLNLFTTMSIKDSMKPQATTKQIPNTIFFKFHSFNCNQEHGIHIVQTLHWHQLFEKCAKVANNSSYTFLQTLLHCMMRTFILWQWKKLSFGINFCS